MRKYFTMMMMAVASLCLTACGDDAPVGSPVSVGTVVVSLQGVSGDMSNIEITLRGNSTFTAKADKDGKATFNVTTGIYEAIASGSYAINGTFYKANGTGGQVVVQANQTINVGIAMKEAKSSQVIIKEIYNGGCPSNDGKTYQFDKCIILYNNSDQQAELSNLCIATCSPGNAHAMNKDYDENGRLVYESQGFTPAQHGMWWFQDKLTIAPYSQVVVNVCGAIDNTLTVSQSVNYANADYYCMYDPESGYNLTSYYPTPADVIPTSHYLLASKFGQGTAWMLSQSSPAFFIYQNRQGTPAEYAQDPDNLWYGVGEQQTPVNACIRIPVEWILDGMEVFDANRVEDSKKRLTADVDGGYVALTNKLGHTLYRNVDKEATEALPENAGKLVYGYTLGVGNSTDPSGIDAEASIKKGAHIVYLDTNNSTADFHERQKFSVRGE